jgi:hypothetical protein
MTFSHSEDYGHFRVWVFTMADVLGLLGNRSLAFVGDSLTFQVHYATDRDRKHDDDHDGDDDVLLLMMMIMKIVIINIIIMVLLLLMKIMI